MVILIDTYWFSIYLIFIGKCYDNSLRHTNSPYDKNLLIYDNSSTEIKNQNVNSYLYNCINSSDRHTSNLFRCVNGDVLENRLNIFNKMERATEGIEIYS
jgi:hypothetical protein